MTVRLLGLGLLLLLAAAACGEAGPVDFRARTAAGGTTMGIGGNSAGSAGVSVSNGGALAGSGGTSAGNGGTTAGNGGSVAGSANGGSSMQESCEGLPEWRGNDPEFTLEAGDEIRHEGKRYRANQDIDYPNGECEPAMPTAWCADWFTDLGEC